LSWSIRVNQDGYFAGLNKQMDIFFSNKPRILSSGANCLSGSHGVVVQRAIAVLPGWVQLSPLASDFMPNTYLPASVPQENALPIKGNLVLLITMDA
jgi:hypothetical protein